MVSCIHCGNVFALKLQTELEETLLKAEGTYVLAT
jgi:hypothetical protein